MKATMKAINVSPAQGASARVAPVTSTDSPSAMMTKSPQRSARCSPSTSQSAVVEAPRPGTKKPEAGPAKSIASAGAQTQKRASLSKKAPAIQNRPDRTDQSVIRWKLRVLPLDVPRRAQSMNSERPTCIAT